MAQVVNRLILRRLGYDNKPLHITFVENNFVLGQIYLRVLRFFPVSITPKKLHTYSSISNAI